MLYFIDFGSEINMSRFKKLIIIIYYLIAVLVLLTLLVITYSTAVSSDMSNYINQLLANENFVETIAVLGIFVLIVVTVKLIAIILKRPDDRYLYLHEECGEISVSDTVIEKTVINALRDFDEVVEQTVKVKIKNKNNKESSVNVNVKCGLDEVICETKGYYEDSSILKEKSYTEKNNKEISLDSEDDSIEKEELISGKTIETDTEKDIEKGFSKEIVGAMSVISEDFNDEEIESEENINKIEEKLDSKDNKCVDVKYMNIDDLCRDIQLYVHETLENLLSQRVDKVNIKFYEVRIKEKSSKKKEDKISKKKQRRVN